MELHELGQDLPMPRLDPISLFQDFQAFREPAPFTEYGCQVEQKHQVLRMEPFGTPQHLDAPLLFTALVQENAVIMPGIGKAGIALDDLSITGFGQLVIALFLGGGRLRHHFHEPGLSGLRTQENYSFTVVDRRLQRRLGAAALGVFIRAA